MASQSAQGIDYSEVHRIHSPANRALRKDLWEPGDDLGQQSFVTPAYFDRFAGMIGMGPGSDVLDVGSGTGGPALYLAERTGCRMTGLEVNSVGVEIAHRMAAEAALGDRVRFVEADGMDMPFPDASFDIVISMNVMNVFEDKVGLFREVRRVLRPGGTWAFLSGTFEFGEGDEDARERIARGYAIPQYTDSLAGYKAKLREAGFVVDEVTEFISDFRNTMQRWLDGWTTHRDAIAAEQGAEQTDHHIVYFQDYLAMIDAGKASNHFIIASRPDD
jgi:ubiquinone/menaquinone biosynthesis C-methylase UbiE